MTALRSQRVGRSETRLSRETIKEALREYQRLYGDDFPQSAFSPASARRNGRPELAARYKKGRPNPDGTFPAGTRDDPAIPWPSLNAIKSYFDGSFNKAREAIGLEPNSTGPARGRRKAGEAEPILDIRVERVYVPSDATVALRRQLTDQTRRADRLAEQLDAEKQRVVEAPAEHTDKIKRLTDRLADEQSRRRKAARGLATAERSLARSARAAEKADTARLTEVQRLTDRLADAEARLRTVDRTLPPLRKENAKPRTVVRTRTVKVTDESTLRQLQKNEELIAELRRERRELIRERAELIDRLDTIRADAIGRAAASQQVRAAENRARQAEARETELAMLICGQRRTLTENELITLRRDGPAGEPLLALALAKLRKAQRSHSLDGKLTALTELAGAAQNWKDRLIR